MFKKLAGGIGAGFPIPSGWETIIHHPCLIIVGNIGVGKSTAINSLRQEGLVFSLLPNRRILTNEFILAPVLKKDGKEVQELDRLERFHYTCRYREKFPSGIAHVLKQIHINPQQVQSLLIFDGLRGEKEVSYAVENLPLAKFIYLNAPDIVRLERLLQRQDSFDFIEDNDNLDILETSLKIFTNKERKRLLSLVENKQIEVGSLQQKLKIITTEKSNYDIEKTKLVLETTAPQRTLFIDSSIYLPQQIALEIISCFQLTLRNQS